MAEKTAFKYPEFPSLYYPDDIGTETGGSAEGRKRGKGFDYPDCVRFSVMKRYGVKIKDIISAGNSAGKFVKGAWVHAMASAGIPSEWSRKEMSKSEYQNLPDKERLDKVIAAHKAKWVKDHPPTVNDDGTTTPQKMPENLAQVVTGGLNTFMTEMGKTQENVKKLIKQEQHKHELGSIYLNMPNAIQFNEEANWSGTELGVMGNAVKSVVGEGKLPGGSAAGAVAGNVGNIIGGSIGGITSLMGKMGISGGMFGVAMGAMAAGSPIQKGMEAALAVAENPYMEMMFSGIGFRQFQFDFTFRPKNLTEQTTIQKIIKMFRLNSRPTFTEGAMGKSFMNYPMEFKIEFLTRNNADTFVLNPGLPKMKSVVCGNVTTNYTPDNAWIAHKGGHPNAIQLSLTFKETELVMAEDIFGKKTAVISGTDNANNVADLVGGGF